MSGAAKARHRRSVGARRRGGHVAAWFLLSRWLRIETRCNRVAAWATPPLAVSPLFWMSGSGPMSDMPGWRWRLARRRCCCRARPARLMQGPARWVAVGAGAGRGVDRPACARDRRARDVRRGHPRCSAACLVGGSARDRQRWVERVSGRLALAGGRGLRVGEHAVGGSDTAPRGPRRVSDARAAMGVDAVGRVPGDSRSCGRVRDGAARTAGARGIGARDSALRGVAPAVPADDTHALPSPYGDH